MKHLIIILSLLFSHSANAQKITKAELNNTEWKLKHKNELYFYQSGKFQLTLLLLETGTTTYTLEGMKTSANLLTFVKSDN